MVNVFLLLVLFIMAVVILFSSAVLIVKFGHPDDKNEAKLPKIVTLLGLFLAFSSVLILPYDVANSRGQGGGLEVGILWQIVYICLAVMIFGLIPYAFFFYESDQDDEKAAKSGTRRACTDTQTGAALLYTLAFAVIMITLCLVMWAFMGEATIPVTRIAVSATSMMKFPRDAKDATTIANWSTLERCDRGNCVINKISWTVPVTFPVFLMAFLSLLGWFFFMMFVGVGLMALPLDLINEYRTRPTPMSKKQYFEEKINLGKRAQVLIEVAEKMKDIHDRGATRTSKERKLDKKNMLKFEQHYYFLKKDYKVLHVAHALKGGNPLWYFFKLFCGIISVVLSLTWILHIVLFVLPAEPFTPFLNSFFIDLEGAFGGGFPLFGTTAFAIYSFYLLWCCVKGNFKLGVRFLVWKLYPMELGNTMMNAFLVNTWLILLCSVPTVQFCTTSFPIYARYTDIDMLFGTQVQYLPFFHFLWENNIFVIVMLVFTFLTGVWLMVYPQDKAADIDKALDKLAKDKDDV